jgi:hypothetical protein
LLKGKNAVAVGRLTALSGPTQRRFALYQKFLEGRITHMPRSKPLTIGGQHFQTQKAANLFLQELLNGQPLKVAIPEPHHSFLCALISRHPRAAEKIGGGIDHFTVEPATYGTRCCYLTRVDGTRTDFSFFKCTRGDE